MIHVNDQDDNNTINGYNMVGRTKIYISEGCSQIFLPAGNAGHLEKTMVAIFIFVCG